MREKNCLPQRASPGESGRLPEPKPGARAGKPPWVPEGVAYEMFSENLRAMIAEIVEPAYEQLVVRARDALEKTTGLTIVHLVWQEIVDQVDLAHDYEHVGAVLHIVTPNREEILERHLRIVYAKLKAANYLMRVRESRRELARIAREAKAGRDAQDAPAPTAHQPGVPNDGPPIDTSSPNRPA